MSSHVLLFVLESQGVEKTWNNSPLKITAQTVKVVECIAVADLGIY